MIEIGRTGKIIEGHVLDCNKRALELALKQYDKQLYLKWNPYKTILTNGKTRLMPPEGEHWQGWGHGCWELRRRPNEKRAVPRWEIGDSIVFDIQFVENDIENHVKDFPYLNYSILQWVKDHDCWNVKDYARELEYREDKSYEKDLDDSQAELRYRIRHERRAMKDFQDRIKSGESPLNYLSGSWEPGTY